MSIIEIDFKNKKKPMKPAVEAKEISPWCCIKGKTLYPDHYFEIDIEAQRIICKICKKQFSPWFTLEALADADSQFSHNTKEHLRVLDLLEKKTRVKCRHCNKFTTINKV